MIKKCTASSGSKEGNTQEDFQEEEAQEKKCGVCQASGLGRKNVGVTWKQRERKGVREARMVILERPKWVPGG